MGKIRCWVFYIRDSKSLNGLDVALRKGPDPSEAKIYNMNFMQKRRASIKENDRVVLFNGKAFLYSGKVTKIEISDMEKEDVSIFRQHSVQIEIDDSLTKNNSVSDLAFSLIKVKRHENPTLYFRRKYNSIENQDYDTIVSGSVFLSRTAFGKIIKCLHPDHELDFIKFAIDQEAGRELMQGGSYRKAVDLLQIYLQEHLLIYGRYLIATRDLIVEELTQQTGVDVSKIRFSSDSVIQDYAREEINQRSLFQPAPDSFMRQAQYFDELFKFERESNFWNGLNELIEKNRQTENRLEKKFSGTPWPLRINYGRNR